MPKPIAPLEWQYSRTRHRHYAVGRFGHEYAIASDRQLGQIHLKADGYTLFMDGRRRAAAFTVKELKPIAETLNARATK
jgi:hypothetical protein